MSNIFIYDDEGVSEDAKAWTYQMVTSHGMTASFVNSFSLRQYHLLKTAKLLIMPGGRDAPYHQKLQGRANQNIRQFVLDGGSYLGICAGGYYGASEIIFEKNLPNEVVAKRDLKFFPGQAVGTVFSPGTFKYNSESGAQLAEIEVSHELFNGQKFDCYYNGGCCFIDPSKNRDITVLARYTQSIYGRAPAIVLCHTGKGKAMLSGVHFEQTLDGAYSPSQRALQKCLFSALLQRNDLHQVQASF